MDKSYVVRIEEVIPHDNADRLEICKVLGWYCVAAKGQFKHGDLAVYFEVDSVLPPELVATLFANSKIQPDKGRIRAVKIRGVFSQGLLASTDLIPAGFEVGASCDDTLGVTKYEPPTRHISQAHGDGIHRRKSKKSQTMVADIPRYIDTIRFERCPNIFAPDEWVHVTAKIHGTSARFGWANIEGRTKWAKIKVAIRKLFGKGTVFVAGSRNVDFNNQAIYAKCAQKYGLKEKLGPKEVLFGEIAGYYPEGGAIQANGYTYGCRPKEHKLFAYALMRDGKYVDYGEFLSFCFHNNIPCVPLLSHGPFSAMPPKDALFADRSEHEQDIPCREGIVVGSWIEQSHPNTGSRKIVKMINPEYLLDKNNSDEH